jgi:two-component system, LytTR family, sensor kinase
MLSNKRVNLILHFFLWVPSIGVPLFLIPLKDGASNPQFLSISKLVFTVAQIMVFYTMVYYLYPKYFLKKRIKEYLIILTSMCLFIAVLSAVAVAQFDTKYNTNLWVGVTIKFLISMAVMATGTSYMLIIHFIRDQRLQQENLKTELVFLRSQVSPHFMFNTLNSIVSLARKRSDKLEPALLELSNLMHYMLYESDEEKVCLRKEIDYIQSYIDLQTLRFGHQVRITFRNNNPPEELSIEPMLLIPLIENAFKHGIGLIDDPEITIDLEVQQSELSLTVLNKFNPGSLETKDKTSGIGLTNLERRLKLLYPNKHTLSAVKNGNYFNASLKIYLNDQVPGS